MCFYNSAKREFFSIFAFTEFRLHDFTNTKINWRKLVKPQLTIRNKCIIINWKTKKLNRFLDDKYMSLSTMSLTWQADQNNNEIILDLIIKMIKRDRKIQTRQMVKKRLYAFQKGKCTHGFDIQKIWSH